MDCHECAESGSVRSAVAVCRFCMVGLCKDHLVAAFRSRTVPQYGCDHQPDRAFRPVPVAAPQTPSVATGRGA